MLCTLQELAAELSALALRLIYICTFSHPFFTFGMVTFSNAQFTGEKSGLARTSVSVPTRTTFSQKFHKSLLNFLLLLRFFAGLALTRQLRSMCFTESARFSCVTFTSV